MKQYVFYLSLLLTFFVISCNQEKKAREVASYTYEENKSGTVPGNILVPGEWVKKDVVCYGLVVNVDKDGNPKAGKPVKARVIGFQSNGVQMKSLEDVNIIKVKGCERMGISKGQTWLETEGELFTTREEAESYLKKKNLLLE